MVDTEKAVFWASWQGSEGSGDGAIEDAEVHGAEAAIAWGRARSSIVFIRLGHRGDTYFWAGEGPEPVEEPDDDPLPVWPPSAPPPAGWWTPEEQA
jgi:hypothetical protein